MEPDTLADQFLLDIFKLNITCLIGIFLVGLAFSGKVDDIESLYEHNIQLLYSAPKELKVLGITGGEPTLLGGKLITLLQEVRKCLPETAIQ